MEAKEDTKEAEQKKTIQPWMLIVLGIVVGFGALVFSSTSSSTGPVGAADGYIADFQAGKCSEIYENLSDNLKRIGDEEEWNERCTEVGEAIQGEVEQFESNVSSDPEQDEEAEITYIVDGANGKTYGVGIGLVNQEGVWQLGYFDYDELTEEDLKELDAQ